MRALSMERPSCRPRVARRADSKEARADRAVAAMATPNVVTGLLRAQNRQSVWAGPAGRSPSEPLV